MTLYVYDPAFHLYAGYRPVEPDDITDALIDELLAIVEAGVVGSAGRMYARTEIADALREAKA